MSLPKEVTMIEVGPRDGLQNEKSLIPTEVKIAFINALKDAGLKEMELTSFVSPKWVPQMKDAEAVLEHCLDKRRNFVLAPNQKGVERFYQSGAGHIAVFVGVSDSFNKKNINKTTEESMIELKPLIRDLKENGKFVRACISTAFFCPYEGKVSIEDTVKLCETFAAYGVDELSVADTVGMANPKHVHELFTVLKPSLPESVLLTGHFHNTRGMALANIYASLEAGISRFDSSAGGLGGCPFAPGASGNVATEDVLFMLAEMEIETGVNIEKVVSAVDLVAPYMSRPLDSKIYHLRENIKQKG
ncbi:hydroxymethylglutaryl-CoA lyase [Scopulibacillus darangshiensis]|uniref:Hydroxymethylglutaryl-CoA lyase n=1 Tax=Scopulibacillus darangshiensis TaxID=442528 RepID=A0A4V2SNM9_9BACL|nr:hydroxymethylglutaryl-CoA lyase [Scopulibacillus darangshiensis]TCP31746.1 hydroxymethylglutaryl-CoA lyase [Scopulibacillus darangshiensis]